MHDERIEVSEEEDADAGARDLTLEIADQIRTMIGERFHGHALGTLLEVEGFATHVAPPGPDGGFDILAGEGGMGFDGIRLAVQVKSGTTVCDAPTLRELQGVMANFGASHGLLVSWGGFTKVARGGARRLFFQVRLWDSRDLIEKIQQNYEKLPEAVRSEMPMKQVWTAVVDET